MTPDNSESASFSVAPSAQRGPWVALTSWLGRGLPVLLAATLVTTGCQSYDSSSSGGDPSISRSTATVPVVLGEGDGISLIFAGAPEYNATQKIRADGKISLALLGEVMASGKTLPQLQQEISALYKPQLQNPAVVVTLVSSSDAVIISGEVNAPGRRVFDKPTTLLEAIMEAGGFSGFANESKVRIIRVVGDSYQTEVVDMKNALKGRPVKVVYVKGGDLINVPE